MNDKIYLNRLDDTLRYRAIAQRTLTQETLCARINVTLLVSVTQTDQAELHRQIRDALNRFMPEVDWVFSTLYREGNRTVGFEQINLTASARIPCAQNFNLHERARYASREGLTLSNATVDYSLPFSLVNSVVHELRGEILSKVLIDIADFERQTGRKWRIGDVEFGGNGRSNEYTAKGAQRSNGYENLFDEESEGLTGAERISLVAEITLRAIPDK